MALARKSRPNARRARPGSVPGRLASELSRLGPLARLSILVGALLGAVAAPIAVLGSRSGSAFASHTPVVWPALAVAALGFALFGGCTVWLSVTDVRDKRLPNEIVALATVGLVVPLSIASLLWGDVRQLGLTWASAAGILALITAAWLWQPRLWGAGDVKLSFAVGFLASWVLPVASLLLFPVACLVALLITGIVALLRRQREIAYGPQLLAAGWMIALVGPEMWRLIGG